MRRLLLVLAAVFVVGCAPRPGLVQPPPLDPSPGARWTYGAYLLGRGDAARARTYLEPLASGDLAAIANPAQLMRDVAEARLFSGELPQAAAAVRQATALLGQQPTTAQFRPDDRAIFARTLLALDAAANADSSELQQLTSDEHPAPCADAWYLLGWLDEQHGDSANARLAYMQYLSLAPQWSFLRAAATMRAHAQALSQ